VIPVIADANVLPNMRAANANTVLATSGTSRRR